MCGRFGFRGTPDEFDKVFGYKPKVEQLANYNIAPTTSVLYADSEALEQGTMYQAQWG